MNRTRALQLLASAGAGTLIAGCAGTGLTGAPNATGESFLPQVLKVPAGSRVVSRFPKTGAKVEFFPPGKAGRIQSDSSSTLSLSSAYSITPCVYQGGGREVYKVLQIYNFVITVSNGTTYYAYFDGKTLINTIVGGTYGYGVWACTLMPGNDGNMYFNLVKVANCNQVTLSDYINTDAARRPLSVKCNLVGVGAGALTAAAIKVMTGIASAAIIDAAGSLGSKIGTACGVEIGPAGMLAGAIIGQEAGQAIAAATLNALSANAAAVASFMAAVATGVCDDLSVAPVGINQPPGDNVDPLLWPDPSASTIAIGDIGNQAFSTSASCCFPIPQ